MGVSALRSIRLLRIFKITRWSSYLVTSRLHVLSRYRKQFFSSVKVLGKEAVVMLDVFAAIASPNYYTFFTNAPLFLQMLEYPSRININFLLFPLFVCSYINHGCFVSITHIQKSHWHHAKDVAMLLISNYYAVFESLSPVFLFLPCVFHFQPSALSHPHDRSPPGHSCEFRWNRMANPKAELILWYQCIARFTSSSHF